MTRAKRKRCTIGALCRAHGHVHGAEAEELRSGIEALIRGADRATVTVHDLVRLLDKIDARDSLAFLESQDDDTEVD